MNKLFMVLVGCRPKGRFTEQHDVFFGIGSKLSDLIPHMLEFWPEAAGNLHVDGWREVNWVDGYSVTVVEKTPIENPAQLFFINLGGYKPNEFEEFHYKILAAASDKGTAIQTSRQTSFYKHTGFKGANSHVDDKYGIDVDDVFEIQDMLSPVFKNRYSLQLTKTTEPSIEDEIHLGYFKLSNLD